MFRIVNFIRNRDERLALHIVSYLLAIYFLLTVTVWLLPVTILDVKVSTAIQRLASEGMDRFMYFVSWFGTAWGAITTVLSTAAVFWLTKHKHEARFILLSGLSFPIITLFKMIVNRQRPTSDLVRVVYEAHFQSFPSGHVAFYVVFFGCLAYLLYKMQNWPYYFRLVLGGFCVLMILLVPLSRVYLGVHWFTDVLAGFFLGLVLLIGLLKWYSWSRQRRSAQAVVKEA